MLRRTRTERGRRSRHSQSGFSLVEVVVAVGLLVLVLVALLPELVVGIRATAAAKNLTQAKGVLQGQLEQMRSMPYHVGYEAGPFVDMLDTYYPNKMPPPSSVSPPLVMGCKPNEVWATPAKEWSGFVPEGGVRCTYEPGSGAFYRTVIPNITEPGLGSFTLVVDTAFLNSAVPPAPKEPKAVYNSVPRINTTDSDTPASLQVGVWATIVYRSSSAMKPVTTYTQLSARNTKVSALEVAAAVNTVRVTSQSPISLITLDMGVLAQSGALFTGSTVSMNASAARAGSGTGVPAEGAYAMLSAPASAEKAATAPGWQQLDGSCQYVCFGGSSASEASVSASEGLPLSPAPGRAPVRVALTSGQWPGYSGAKYGGFWFNNDPDSSGVARGLADGHPMVTLDGNAPGSSYAQSDCLTSSESTNLVSASGFLDSDPLTDTTPAATSCVTGWSAPVMLFPTSWAPNGVIQVTLEQSSLKCQVVRSATGVRSATANPMFSARVKYWKGSSWVTLPTVTQSSLVDPLAGVDLSTIVSPTNVSPALTLGDFILSWRASTKGDVVVDKSAEVPGTSVRAKVPGVISIDSQPTRADDPNSSSVVSVTIGTFECVAKDIR